jgi:23S rRNA pseudouridine2605 synthase
VRLAKYIAHAGIASRRAADEMIAAGRVEIDGETVTDPARDVADDNRVVVDGRGIRPERLEYHLLNKPRGIVSTAHDPQGRRKVTDLAASRARLYPVGRLDADSTGLILLTNDGELANRLMHPRYEVDKTYRVRVSGRPGRSAISALRSGVELDDGRTAPARVRLVRATGVASLLEITIHEGRKRIVRRMCEAVGHPVLSLKRTAFGPLRLENLPTGKSRRLRPREVAGLRRAAGLD